MWNTRIITNSSYKYLIFIEGLRTWNSLIPPISGVFGEGFCPIMLPFVRIREWVSLGFDSTIPTVDSLNIIGCHKVDWISVTSWQFVDLMYELWFHLGKKIVKQKIHESLVSSKKKHEHDARDSYNLYLKKQKQKQTNNIS